ncbi:MAG: hypothetical protein NVS4B3_05900 [Gemmatimonadaceae bacterium]
MLVSSSLMTAFSDGQKTAPRVVGLGAPAPAIHADSVAGQEPLFRALVENASDTITINAADGTLIYASPSVERVLGYSLDEYRSLDRAQLVHPEDRLRVAAAFRPVNGISGASGRSEHRLRHKDGSWRTLDVRARNLLDDPAVRGIVVTGTDVTETRGAEASLRESEERYRTVFGGNAAIQLLIDTETHCIADANPAAVAFYGYGPGELVGRAITTINDMNPDEASGRMERIVSGERAQFRTRHRIASGAIREVEVYASAVRLDGRCFSHSIIHDVTDRLLAESSLRESEERHRALLDSLPIIVYRASPVPPYRTTYVSRAAETLEYPLADWVEQSGLWASMLHPDDRDRILAQTERARSERVAVDYEYRVMTARGHVRWLHHRGDFLCESDGRLSVWQGIIVDITARKAAEDARRHSEERYRIVARATNDVLWDWDLVTNDVEWNDAIFSAFRYPADEPVGAITWWYDHIHPRDRDRVVLGIHAVVDGGGHSWSAEYRFRRADGSFAFVLDRGYVLRADDGKPVRMIGSMFDLTERQSLEEQLRQAHKMEAVGSLAGGVAHDFNNLLTAITANCSLAIEDLPADSPAREPVDEIQKVAERAAGLTRQLLAFSRRQVLRPEVLDLNAVVVDLERLLRRVIGENIVVVTALAPAVGAVRADRGQVEQVVMNLVVNARDAMVDGGVLRIATADMDIDDGTARKYEGMKPGRYVALSVRDTGHGMDAGTLARVFEPFFTTKSPGKGTGLGLSMVYGIMKQSAGYVSAESVPGTGATFTVYLPRVDATTDHTASPTADAEVDIDGSETVLLVEDEAAVRRGVRRMLERKHYTVVEATNGTEALQLFSLHPSPISLVISDLVMPAMGGLELARQLRAIAPGVKLLLMSGYSGDLVTAGGELPRDAAFIQKPFTVVDFLHRVRAILDAGR